MIVWPKENLCDCSLGSLALQKSLWETWPVVKWSRSHPRMCPWLMRNNRLLGWLHLVNNRLNASIYNTILWHVISAKAVDDACSILWYIWFGIRHVQRSWKHLLFFFQATINLLIGYEPPANATPNLNDQPDGDVSHVDAGKLTGNLRN